MSSLTQSLAHYRRSLFGRQAHHRWRLLWRNMACRSRKGCPFFSDGRKWFWLTESNICGASSMKREERVLMCLRSVWYLRWEQWTRHVSLSCYTFHLVSSWALRHLDASAVFGGSFLVVCLHDDTCLHLHSISCIGSLSPSFFLHLANACIVQTCKIKKATNSGGSTCFERFDIDYFFQGGKRKYAHREHTHLRCGPRALKAISDESQKVCYAQDYTQIANRIPGIQMFCW